MNERRKRDPNPPNPRRTQWAKLIHYRKAEGEPPLCNSAQPGRYTVIKAEMTCRSCRRRLGMRS